MVHNHYRNRGGEDLSFEAEVGLLRGRGHEVRCLTMHSREAEAMSAPRLAASLVWNRRAAMNLKSAVREFDPQVIHIQNTFPLISPAVCRAAHATGLPVVMTLRNYRLFCVGGTFFRNGAFCDHCLGRAFPWPAVGHGCYRGERCKSLAMALMNRLHELLGTWRDCVDMFVATSNRAREIFIRAGLPADRVEVKPNFLPDDPGLSHRPREFALYAGRLSREKGILDVIEAWKRGGIPLPLKIIGNGPLEREIRAGIKGVGNVDLRGWQSHGHVLKLMGRAAFLVAPSRWEEPFGRVVMEAFSRGTAVVAARAGALAELVRDKETGLLFSPGSVREIEDKCRRAANDPGGMKQMGARARMFFEENFIAEVNYCQLMKIYAGVSARRHGA